ncbi:MAG: hypothetical protein JXR07_04885 [Reichenbachiella sp.]
MRILILLCIFSWSSFAQEHEDYSSLLKNPNYLKCVVVNLDNEKIPALMENYREAYKRYGTKNGKIDFILSTTGKKTIKATDLISYNITLRNKKEQRFVCVDGIVVRVKYSGERIKLFEREEFTLKAPKTATMISPNVRRRYYVRKKYEAYLTDVDDIADVLSLSEYFEDCPSLSKRIGQPKSKVRDIVSIVKRYDACESEE